MQDQLSQSTYCSAYRQAGMLIQETQPFADDNSASSGVILTKNFVFDFLIRCSLQTGPFNSLNSQGFDGRSRCD
jgi:hypothetical protein